MIASEYDSRTVTDYFSYTYNTLDTYFAQSDADPDNLPELIDYEKVFVTFLTDGQTRCCQSGNSSSEDNNRYSEDIKEAVTKCVEDNRFGGVLDKTEIDEVETILTFLYNRREISGTKEELENSIELGIHAVGITNPNGSAYYKESVAIDKNYSFDLMMNQLCDKAGLQEECYLDEDTNVYIYDTLTFKGDRDGDYKQYYRYNELLEVKDINNDLLLERIKLMGGWFHRSMTTEPTQKGL